MPECGRGDGAVLAMSGFLSFFFCRSWSGSCQHGNLRGFCGVPPKTFGDALVFIDGSILEMDQTCIVDLKCFPTETTCG